MDRKIFYKLLYYLPPSECTGNSIIYSIGCIRYLVPSQELLNQEHRGIKQATGYFKVWYQLYKHSSSGKTPCVSHSGQVIRRKDKFELPMPNTKPYMSEWTRFSAQSRKTGLPRDSKGKCRYPKVYPPSEGSDPHPQTAGSWGSLGRVQTVPLLGSEIYEHIFEGQLCLKWKHFSPTGPEEGSYFHRKGEEVRQVRSIQLK